MNINAKLKRLIANSPFNDTVQNIADSFYQWSTSRIDRIKTFAASVSSAVASTEEALDNIANECDEFSEGITLPNVRNSSGFVQSFTCVNTTNLVTAINEGDDTVECVVRDMNSDDYVVVNVSTDAILEAVRDQVEEIQSIQAIAKSISISDDANDVIQNLATVSNSLSIANVIDSPMVTNFIENLSSSDQMNTALSMLVNYVANAKRTDDIDLDSDITFVMGAVKNEDGYTDKSVLGYVGGYIWDGAQSVFSGIVRAIGSVFSFVSKAVVAISYYAWNGAKKLWSYWTDPSVLIQNETKRGDGSIFETSNVNLIPVCSIVHDNENNSPYLLCNGLFPWVEYAYTQDGMILRLRNTLNSLDDEMILDIFPQYAESYDRNVTPLQAVKEFIEYFTRPREWSIPGMKIFTWISYRDITRVINGMSYVQEKVPFLAVCYRLRPQSVYPTSASTSGVLSETELENFIEASMETGFSPDTMYNVDGTVKYSAGSGSWTQNKLLNGFLMSAGKLASCVLGAEIAADMDKRYSGETTYPIPSDGLPALIACKGWNSISGGSTVYAKSFYQAIFNDMNAATGASVLRDLNVTNSNRPDDDITSGYVHLISFDGSTYSVNDADADTEIFFRPSEDNYSGITFSGYNSTSYTCTENTSPLFYYFMSSRRLSNVTNSLFLIIRYLCLKWKSQDDYIPQRAITSLPTSSFSLITTSQISKRARNLVIGAVVAIVAVAGLTTLVKIKRRIKSNYEYANTEVFNVATEYAQGTASKSDFNKALKRQRQATMFQNLFNAGSAKAVSSLADVTVSTNDIVELIRG